MSARVYFMKRVKLKGCDVVLDIFQKALYEGRFPK